MEDNRDQVMSPEEFLERVWVDRGKLTPDELRPKVELARAWATKEFFAQIPEHFEARLRLLEDRL